MKKKKKHGALRVLSALLGLVCALILGTLFYGTMVYQLAGEDSVQKEDRGAALLSLPAVLNKEETQEVLCGGEKCRVTTRTYVLEDGLHVKAVSATPASYFERLSQEGFVPQLVTGFSLAGLDAVYARRGDAGMLAAREGDYVYLLEADVDEQTLYSLGAGAKLEN